MKKIVIAALMLLPMTGFAAGFDCEKAGTRIEHMICDNPELDQLDEEMTMMYRALSSGPDAAQIQKEQREWNKSRNKAQTPEELAQMYDDRMSELAEGKPAPVEPKPVKQSLSTEDELVYHKYGSAMALVRVCTAHDLVNASSPVFKKSISTEMVTYLNKLTTDFNREIADQSIERYTGAVERRAAMQPKEFVNACRELNYEALGIKQEIEDLASTIAIIKMCEPKLADLKHKELADARIVHEVNKMKAKMGVTYDADVLNEKYTDYVNEFSELENLDEMCDELAAYATTKDTARTAAQDKPF